MSAEAVLRRRYLARYIFDYLLVMFKMVLVILIFL